MADEEETPEESAESAEASAPLDLKGHRLDEMGGAQVGKIEGRIVSDAHGGMEWLLARMGRFGHYCLVPGRDAVVANGRVWVPYTRDQIRRAPRVDPGKQLDPEAEAAMLDHYGLGTKAPPAGSSDNG